MTASCLPSTPQPGRRPGQTPVAQGAESTANPTTTGASGPLRPTASGAGVALNQAGFGAKGPKARTHGLPSPFWRGFAHGSAFAVAGWAVGVVIVQACRGAV